MDEHNIVDVNSDALHKEVSEDKTFYLCQPENITNNDIQYHICLSLIEIHFNMYNSIHKIKYFHRGPGITVEKTLNNWTHSTISHTYITPELIKSDEIPKEIIGNVMKFIPKEISITITRSVKHKSFSRTLVKRTCRVQFKLPNLRELQEYTINLI
jgi:hypothetical protein